MNNCRPSRINRGLSLTHLITVPLCLLAAQAAAQPFYPTSRASVWSRPMPVPILPDGHELAPVLDADSLHLPVHFGPQRYARLVSGNQSKTPAGRAAVTEPSSQDASEAPVEVLPAKAEPESSAAKKQPEPDPRCRKCGRRCCGTQTCGPHGKSSLDCCAADYQCECKVEKEKVEHECFVVNCEPVCIPPILVPWGGCCKLLGGRIRCIKILSSDKYECEEEVVTWDAKKIAR